MKEFVFDCENPSFISGWFMDESICDGIIDFYNEENIFPIKQGRSSATEVDTSIKESYDKCFSHVCTDFRITNYLNCLETIIDLYIDKFEFSGLTQKWSICELVNIQYYPPGGGYKVFHFERNGSLSSIKRHLVFMTYLNDVNDAGETEFFYQKLKVKPKKGLTLIWPVDWTHTHRGIPSPTEEKIITTGWYSFP